MAALATRASRPLWLITLADLSLLLVGFFVFLQATSHKTERQQAAIEAGIRGAFGGVSEPRLAVDANALDGYAPGSAALPADTGAIVAWAQDALSDPRTRLIVTGYADGSAGDRMDGSALALAGLRADMVAAELSGAIPADRVRMGAAIVPGARRVTFTISYDP